MNDIGVKYLVFTFGIKELIFVYLNQRLCPLDCICISWYLSLSSLALFAKARTIRKSDFLYPPALNAKAPGGEI